MTGHIARRENGREEATVRVPSGPLPSVAPDSGAFVVTSRGEVLLQHVRFNHQQGTSLTRVVSLSLLLFARTQHTRTRTHQMLEDHVIGRDMCVIGPKGSGKSTLVKCVVHCSLQF